MSENKRQITYLELTTKETMTGLFLDNVEYQARIRELTDLVQQTQMELQDARRELKELKEAKTEIEDTEKAK
ncbi:hypothetical protein F373_gp164 [Bacillus phage SP-10]|uniref:hypothetical protein n=1 Tax=Bacillus phage SP10 TaxID=941058 RepID=UPI0002198B78|nr:hypothetical protein F373_gp164 [Bacillus phage SP-10]BAK52976.1 hypothetical protein [Bacillus phage SP-10]